MKQVQVHFSSNIFQTSHIKVTCGFINECDFSSRGLTDDMRISTRHRSRWPELLPKSRFKHPMRSNRIRSRAFEILQIWLKNLDVLDAGFPMVWEKRETNFHYSAISCWTQVKPDLVSSLIVFSNLYWRIRTYSMRRIEWYEKKRKQISTFLRTCKNQKNVEKRSMRIECMRVVCFRVWDDFLCFCAPAMNIRRMHSREWSNSFWRNTTFRKPALVWSSTIHNMSTLYAIVLERMADFHFGVLQIETCAWFPPTSGHLPPIKSNRHLATSRLAQVIQIGKFRMISCFGLAILFSCRNNRVLFCVWCISNHTSCSSLTVFDAHWHFCRHCRVLHDSINLLMILLLQHCAFLTF